MRWSGTVRILLASFALVSCRSAYAWCDQPPIRLDDEFFVSDIVFSGTIVADQKIGDDGLLFTWRVDRRFRGQLQVGQSVKTYTGNDSGRFPLESGGAVSQVGRKFLVFAFQDREAQQGAYAIDNCGNSRPLRAAAKEIRQILDLPSHHGGLLYGSMFDGETGVRITAHGKKGEVFSTMTLLDGRFFLRLPPATYQVVAKKSGHIYTQMQDAYKDPSAVVVPEGGSAGLSFREKNH